MWLLILVVIIAGCALAYRHRVALLAKVLGQSETRVRRQLGQRKR